MSSTKRQVSTSEFLATHPVFSLEEAVGTLGGDGDSARMVERLRHHVESGRLTLVSRGLYATVPPGTDPDNVRPDPFLVAAAARSDAVFCHHSALELLGAAHSAWRGCTVWTSSRRPPLDLDGAEIRFLEHPKALRDAGAERVGVRQVAWGESVLTTTGPERTLVEGFRRPALAGGVEELVASAAGFAVLDLSLLETILELYDQRTLWGAVGWFLETYQRTFAVSEDLLEEWEERRPASPHYLVRQSRGGGLVRRWNLVLPSAVTAREPDATDA